MNGWGGAFSRAWNAASDAGRKAASTVATGAKAIGRTTVHAVEWSGQKTVDAAKWTAAQTANAAKWTYAEAAAAASWAGHQVATGVHAGERVVADHAFDVLGTLEKSRLAAGQKVRNVFRSLRKFVPGASPTTCAPCASSDPAKDVDFDGALIGFPHGRGASCEPVTSKGQIVGSAAIANAEKNGYRSESDCCRSRRKAGMPPRTIFYVNGINTTKQQHCETLKAIGESTCATVVGIYNATEGFYRDTSQTSQDRRLIKNAHEGHEPQTHDGRNPSVDSLSDVIYANTRSGQPPEIWCHSQGGAVTSLALYEAANALRASTKGGGKRMAAVRVKSFGSAAPYWPNGPQYEHYVHVNDATPRLFGLGETAKEDRQRAGEDAKIIRFSGEPKGSLFDTKQPRIEHLPSTTANHGVEDTYLKVQQQVNGGCPMEAASGR